MKHKATLLLAAGMFLAPLASAQETKANVGRIYWTWARPGQAQQYEAGSKKHSEFHKMKNDPWTWSTWQVVSGNRAGHYVTGTFGHEWKDFDNLPVAQAEDDADYFKNVEPYESNWRGEHVVLMPAHSRPPDSTDPYPLYELWLVHIKPGKAEQYLNAIKKIPGAIEKVGVPWHYTFWSVADGNSGSSFYVSFPMKTWAERGENGPSFEEVLTKAYSSGEAHAIMDAISDAEAERTSMLLVYRPDLSYTPVPAK